MNESNLEKAFLEMQTLDMLPSRESLRKQFPKALNTIKFPLRYDEYGQYIWDASDNMILEVRGWGWIQRLDTAEERQDEIGQLIVFILNQYFQNG